VELAQQLRDKYQQDLDRIRRELSEMEVLLRQTHSEVEKLTQREVSIANRLRDLEVNLDKYSKADVKNFYTSAQEVQMRLLMMRGQQEQQQLRQQTLKQTQSQLFELVQALEQIMGETGSSSTGNGMGGADEESLDQIASIIQSQEKERLRISLQMHDGPAQSLSNLVLRAEICQRLLDRDVEQARAELSSLKSAINNTLQDTRRFIFDLRPMILDDLGLVPTLRRYVSQFGEKNNLEINLMVGGLDTRLPNHYEVTIYRFVQEALNNIAKHANATQARVNIDAVGNQLQIVIEDDGSGFSVSDVLNDQNVRHNMGISNMRQQIETLLRGEFGLESAIGRGTRVAAVVPLP